jgi:hypothetical protein
MIRPTMRSKLKPTIQEKYSMGGFGSFEKIPYRKIVNAVARVAAR